MRNKWRQTIDPGLGENYNSRTKRLINKDGSSNIILNLLRLHETETVEREPA